MHSFGTRHPTIPCGMRSQSRPHGSLLALQVGTLFRLSHLPSWENSLALRLPSREQCPDWLTSQYRPGLSVNRYSEHPWSQVVAIPGVGLGDRQLQECSSSFCTSSVLGMRNDRVLPPLQFSVCFFMSCLWGSSTQGSSHWRKQVTDGPWTSPSWS